MFKFNQIAHILNSNAIGETVNEIKYLLIDSRQLIDAEHTLFFALVTDKNDAHQYVFPLIQKGVTHFIVNYIPDNCLEFKNKISFIIVDDTLKALQLIATEHRRQFQIPIIGITGSNGKTIVKEWLYQLLKQDYNICRSPKSYNSQVGVPLSVWQLNATHTLGIFEAGISQVAEMNVLQQIIKPTIGVFTSLGTAHDEGFANIDIKLNEKFKLFNTSEVIIVNAVSLTNAEIQSTKHNNIVLISHQKNATLCIDDIENLITETRILASYKNQKLSITIPFTDIASINNALTCWAVMLNLNIKNTEIQNRMLQLQPVAMRLELKLGINNCVLINDFYNSDMSALEIALHHQKQQQRGGQKVVILSDIEQSGKSLSDLYNEVAKLMVRFEIDIVVGIGKDISSQKKQFSKTSLFYNNANDFITESKRNANLQFTNSIILLKGARSFGFESISKYLQQKSHDTVLEINLNKLVHNLNFYRSQISKQTKLMCMVKATGYGSGSTEIAFTLQHHHVDYLAVAYTDEGVELRKAGITLPIMVMSPEETSYDDMITYRLEPEIYSFKVMSEFLYALQSAAIAEPYPVHLKLDTGMHRLGFEENDIEALCVLLKTEKSIHIKSIFSHLVASDNSEFDDFTNSQISLFDSISAEIEHVVGYKTDKHICNSGAITRFKHAHYNMVRLGIGMYGVGFNDIEKQQLQNISSLKTTISQIKQRKPGDTIGYNRNGKITKPTTIATIPIGYADGFKRQLGNGNFLVSIHNGLYPTVGNICMDMCMIDITGCECDEGDTVIIFETNEQLKALSNAMNTIPYEVLTSISTRVKRIYVQE